MKLKRTLLTMASVVATWTVCAPAMADLQLATAKNCMACHAVDKKLVGPSYKEVAAKYAGQADAVAKLEAKVLKGGAGVWGPWWSRRPSSWPWRPVRWRRPTPANCCSRAA